MPLTRLPAALAIAAAVAILLAAVAITAAPRAGAAPPSAEKIKLVRQISKLDGQYASLRNRVKKCAAAAIDVRAGDQQRRNAIRNARVGIQVKTLRTKRARMAAAVVRLANAARRCAVSPTPQATVQAVPSPSNPSLVELSLPNTLSGTAIDLSNLLGGLPLSQVLTLVDVDELGGLLCSATGVTCIGIDTGLLTSAVRRLIANNLLGSLLNLDLAGVLAQVRALLQADDLTGLFEVQRISDTVLRLVPIGPLAGLAALPAIPNLPIGFISLGS
jgi:hypothetical protein